MPLPTGTVTFLFTDLEGQTPLWEERPELMRAALARHDALLRQAVVAHGGQVVKMTGDGVHAVFARAPELRRPACNVADTGRPSTKAVSKSVVRGI